MSISSLIIRRNFPVLNSLKSNGLRSRSQARCIQLSARHGFESAPSGQEIADLASKREEKPNLSFENAKIAFRSKSTAQLLRAYMVFHLCGIRPLIDNQQNILSLTRRVLGKTLFKTLMKHTFYGHFVAGEDRAEIKTTVNNMAKYNVKSILDYSAELDIDSEKQESSEKQADPIMPLSETNGRRLVDPSEVVCEQNVKILLDCIDSVSDITHSTGLTALKLTCLVSSDVFFKFSTAVFSMRKVADLEQIFTWKKLLVKTDAEFQACFAQAPVRSRNP